MAVTLDTLELDIQSDAEGASSGIRDLIDSLKSLIGPVTNVMGPLKSINAELKTLKANSSGLNIGKILDTGKATSSARKTAKELKSVVQSEVQLRKTAERTAEMSQSVWNAKSGIIPSGKSASESASVFSADFARREARNYVASVGLALKQTDTTPVQERISEMFGGFAPGIGRSGLKHQTEFNAMKETFGPMLRMQGWLERDFGFDRQVKSAEESYRVFEKLGALEEKEANFYTGKDWTRTNNERTAYFDARLSSIVNDQAKYNRIRDAVKGMSVSSVSAKNSSVAQSVSEMPSVKDALDFASATSEAEVLKMKIDSIGEKLATELGKDTFDAGKVGQYTSQLNKLNSKLEGLNDNTEKTKFSFADLKKEIHGIFKGGLLQQFGRILRMRAIRAVIMGLAKGFKEGIGNLREWSDGVNGHFSAAMNSAQDHLTLMKNSVATALAPAIEAAIPIFNVLTGAINAASNALAQFFALLTGKSSWTKATLAVGDYTNATKGAGGASKDLLADWDELNVIQSSGGGGGGGSGASVTDMFEEQYAFAEPIRDIAGFLKDNFEDILHVARSRSGLKSERLGSKQRLLPSQTETLRVRSSLLPMAKLSGQLSNLRNSSV